MPSDIEIAQAARLEPITAIGAKLGIPEEHLTPFGRYKAKVSLEFFQSVQARPKGRLVLVTGINPTAAGEGKSTVTVGLGDGLRKLGKRSVVCLREPSLGPCFGVKGGAAGGGYSQVVPMEDINLHFTGDLHAVTTAHNLLAALIDNHIQQGNALDLDVRRIAWRRVLDMNDRALREIVLGLGGTGNGIPRESGFDITVASEVMAVLCLSENLADLKRRLGEMVIGESRKREVVRAKDLGGHGAMTVLLREALAPNLVQTLEGTPAFVHGGPFANIAHGCNSVLATKLALALGEIVVTEAGFGADLGAEKFFDIKCRKAGLTPDAAVIVVSLRALKLHGGVDAKSLKAENVAAIEKGAANVARHIENVRGFGVPVLVALNHMASDTPAEVAAFERLCAGWQVEMGVGQGWAKGGEGTRDLAGRLLALIGREPTRYKPLYPDEMPLWDKARTIAQRIYRAKDLEADATVRGKFRKLQEQGYGNLPICVAKTQYSLTADAKVLGAPEGFPLPIRDVRLSAGAGFVVVLAGDIMTMPGLPKTPAALSIDIDAQGKVVGLF
ncbi:MAG: formate--tetrahydrofolate ligase [Candidatus Lambdaproteobacteria bacterium]|nr:formate--tetrahydrofolate ligase [Candidatus Lambdaproteobacteria bacterium]